MGRRHARAGHRVVDGVDLSPILFEGAKRVRDAYFFYRGEQLYAVRLGPWKAHYITRPAYGRGQPEKHDPPVLYHLGHDPSEKHDLAKEHPGVLEEIAKEVANHNAKLKRGKNQLDLIIKK